WQMSHYTLATSMRGIVAALIIQGFGFSCLFVPLTTVALSTIPRHRLPDATGLNSLVRQIGGSVGLAVFATLMTRFALQMKAAVAAHVTTARPEVGERLAQIARFLVQKGFDLESARLAAGRILGGIVTREAMVMTFEKLFLVSGIAFLCVMPLLYFLEAPRMSSPKADVHVEI